MRTDSFLSCMYHRSVDPSHKTEWRDTFKRCLNESIWVVAKLLSLHISKRACSWSGQQDWCWRVKLVAWNSYLPLEFHPLNLKRMWLGCWQAVLAKPSLGHSRSLQQLCPKRNKDWYISNKGYLQESSLVFSFSSFRRSSLWKTDLL